MKRIVAIASLVLAALPAHADDDVPAASRFALRTAPVIEPATQASDRYSLRARFAPTDRAGDLREGANFTLIGRFAKGGASCDFSALFSDSFEGQ